MYIIAFDLYSSMYFCRTTRFPLKASLQLESPCCALCLTLVMQHFVLVDAVANKNGKQKNISTYICDYDLLALF